MLLDVALLSFTNEQSKTVNEVQFSLAFGGSLISRSREGQLGVTLMASINDSGFSVSLP